MSTSASRSLSFLGSITTIVGTLVVMNYFNKLEKKEGCLISEKQEDFIYKYNVFTLCVSIISIFGLWFGFYT